MSNKINVGSMRKSSIGSQLTEAECSTLGSVMGIRKLRDGEMLAKEGDAVCTLYILIEGKLSL